MRAHMTTADGRVYCVYGDPVYPMTDGFIIAPFRGGIISHNQMIFNKRMSAVRMCVEWAFGKVLTLFAFLDLKKNQKLFLQSVGKYYKVVTTDFIKSSSCGVYQCKIGQGSYNLNSTTFPCIINVVIIN